MAFNWQTFKTRSLTAVFFVLIMLIGLLWNRWSFFILFSIIHFGCWFEYFKLVYKFYPDYQIRSVLHEIFITLAGWMMMLFFTNDELHIGYFHFQKIALILGALLFILVPVFDMIARKIRIPNMAYSIAGLLYISLPVALLVNMRNRWTDSQYQLSTTIPLLIIFSLWINDTMAYIVGSLIGKRPLSSISPKKTWEGTAGGIILTIIAISLLAKYTHRIGVENAAIMSGIAAITGTLGDLAESKLKRMASVKDSGNIMPGHGGFLDRFDSLLFASVFVWFYSVFVFG